MFLFNLGFSVVRELFPKYKVYIVHFCSRIYLINKKIKKPMEALRFSTQKISNITFQKLFKI